MSARLPGSVACALGGILLLGGGCAMHVPVSESVLFHDGATLPTHDNNVGVGVVGTGAPTRSPALALARQTRQDELVNSRKLGGGIFVARYGKEGRYAFSTTLGLLIAGLDATVKIRGRNYLTLGVSGIGQGQVFLQHRTYNSSQFGAAIGVGGRYSTYSYGGSAPLSIDTERVASAGTRVFAIIRAKGDTRGGLKIGTYAGYAPRLNRPILSLTLTVGRF